MFQIFFQDKRNLTPMHSNGKIFAHLFIRSVFMAVVIQHVFCLGRGGLGAPSDYKPPNGGFIYLQKQLYRLLPEIP